MLEWHQKLMKKISERHLRYAVVGKLLFVFSSGAIFSRDLVKFSYFILIAATLLCANYVIDAVLYWHKNKKMSYTQHMVAFIGVMLLVLLFGIQTTQLHFQRSLLIAGVLLVLPASYDVWIRKR
jgi:uncharacterized membrane protein YjjP (DUF1212 family)